MNRIIHALRQGNGQVAIELIKLAMPKELNQFDEYGQTALHIAIQKNMLDIAKALLEKGANINVTASDPSYTEMTPLHYAALTGNEAAVKMLIAWGANTRLENGDFHTAATLAHQHGFIDIAHIIKRHSKPILPYRPAQANHPSHMLPSTYERLVTSLTGKSEMPIWINENMKLAKNVIDFAAYKRKKLKGI